MDERLSIWTYTSTNKNWYEYINYQLRNRPNGDIIHFKDLLNTAISKLDNYKGDVYRGIRVANRELFAFNFVKGSRVRFRSFTSTSKNEKKAFRGNVLFIIDSQNGRILGDYADRPREEEILIAAGTEFEVIDVEHYAVKTVITLDEVV